MSGREGQRSKGGGGGGGGAMAVVWKRRAEMKLRESGEGGLLQGMRGWLEVLARPDVPIFVHCMLQ